jgi:hypothetical protein
VVGVVVVVVEVVVVAGAGGIQPATSSKMVDRAV